MRSLFVVDDFLLDGEADQIIALAKPKLSRAGVAFFEDAVEDAQKRKQAERCCCAARLSHECKLLLSV